MTPQRFGFSIFVDMFAVEALFGKERSADRCQYLPERERERGGGEEGREGESGRGEWERRERERERERVQILGFHFDIRNNCVNCFSLCLCLSLSPAPPVH